MERVLSYIDAIREATDQEMQRDLSVVVFGLDVDDPKAIQGTTRGLMEKYGRERVFGTPLSEDAMTGAAVGMALAGLRPIHIHIRMDFLMLAMNQLVNVAAKSRYMYGGQVRIPIVVRSMIGKSWGQGAQHSQGLYSFFMLVPGLK
ncbi:MAG: alpha-ketoacid dehydrogenase subunit beta, partial [Candidatus Binatia bacterium]